MQILAQSWLVWQLTKSTFWLGLIGSMPQLPSLIIGPFGGVIVDRYFRRSVLIFTQLGLGLSAAALAYFTLTGTVTEWHILVIAGISGLFNAIDTPARLSLAQDLVGKEDIGNAVALNSTTFNMARLIGPSIAGLLVPLIGEGGIFTLNAVSYLALISTLLMMRGLPQPKSKGQSVLEELTEAYEFVKHSPLHRTLIINVMVFGFIGFTYAPLMPVFADHVLDVGVRGLGILMGTIGCGALAGGIRQATLPHDAKRGKNVIFGAFGLGVFAIAFALSRNFYLSLPFLFGLGYSFVNMLASTNTLLQSHAPDELRGRILGFYTTAFFGVLPFANFAVGAIADWYGAPLTMIISGACCLLAAYTTLLRRPELRAV